MSEIDNILFDKDYYLVPDPSRKSLLITNHVTLGVSMSKLNQYGMKMLSSCPADIIPNGNENAYWIEPMVCTVEYMPSETDGLRQAVFKTIRTD